jgi:hypothetical protein
MRLPKPTSIARHPQVRSLFSQLGPGIGLPGLIYFVVSRKAPVIVALAAASAVPLLDAIVRFLRRKPQSLAGLVFIACAAISVGLAVHLHSPIFILAKGAAISAVVGLAFALSAVLKRPLTRTLALRFSTDSAEARERLAERWRHPRAHGAFQTLSIGWGLLLLGTAVQQSVFAATLSPGTMMAVDPPIHAFLTALGVAASVLYARRLQRAHPEIALIPTFNRAAED